MVALQLIEPCTERRRSDGEHHHQGAGAVRRMKSAHEFQ
jgi:hypothetical protein